MEKPEKNDELKTVMTEVLTTLQESLVALKNLLEYEMENGDDEEINFDEF